MNQKELTHLVRQAVHNPQPLSYGPFTYGQISFLNEDRTLIVKEHVSRQHAQREFKIGTLLCENGISTPQVQGLVTSDWFPLFHQNPLRKNYTVHEYIEGRRIRDIEDHKLRMKAYDLLAIEVEKIFELKRGIVPFWDALIESNTLYSSERDKVFLLDFADWKFGSVEEAENRRQTMKESIEIHRL